MTDLNKIAKALRLFNEKADKLTRLSFLEKLSSPQSGVTISFQRTPDGIFTGTQERRLPDEESIDAFVLTFRFFIQDNEQTSFRNMEKHYLDAPIDPSLQQKLVELRKQVNEYLDGPSHMVFNGESFSRRNIMYTFVYGGLAHGLDEHKRRLYLTWMSDPLASGVFEHEFMTILSRIHVAILMIKRMNEEALKNLPGPS